MNQKMLRIVPLMVTMLFVAAFAAGDNVTASSRSTSTVQTAKANVRECVALNVTPTAIKMNGLSGSTVYSGISSSDDNINVKNVGNVPINVFIRSASTQFWAGGSNVFTPTTFTINSQDGFPVDILTIDSNIATNMPKKGAGSSFNTYLTLGIPVGVPAANGYQNPLTYTAIKSSYLF